MSEPITRAEQVLSYAFGGLHNVPGKIRRGDDSKMGGVEVCVYGGLSTFDFERLTRLVLAAHAYCVRVEVSGASPQYVRINLYERHTRYGGRYERHPGLDEFSAMVEAMREREWQPGGGDK